MGKKGKREKEKENERFVLKNKRDMPLFMK